MKIAGEVILIAYQNIQARSGVVVVAAAVVVVVCLTLL